MKINTAWCFFEQSGTFKDEFQKLGVTAFDVDIKNNFGKTDYKLDLFNEIKSAYLKNKSIFDKVKKDDLIFAFFPCTFFSARMPLNARGEAAQMKDWGMIKKLHYSIDLVRSLEIYYRLLCEMIIVCLKKEIRLVIENPYTMPHFLNQYFPIKSAVIDNDRTERGDDFKKPTQYFFVNCEPEHNFIFENISKPVTKKIETVKSTREHSRQELRSMINPIYANRFIREFLLDSEEAQC